MIGSSFRARVLKEGGLIKEGKAKVEDRVVSMFNEDLQMNEYISKYKEIQPINGEDCEILVTGFELETKLEEEREGGQPVEKDCCLQLEEDNKRTTVCILKDELTSDCFSKTRELAVQLGTSCRKERGNSLGQKVDFNEMSYDDHEHGIWRGWARVAGLKGEVPLGATFINLNAPRGTLSLKL